MSIHGFCQNGKCNRKASVQLNPKGFGNRKTPLHLCAEDAAYFLELRDSQDAHPKTIERCTKFVENCHKD